MPQVRGMKLLTWWMCSLYRYLKENKKAFSIAQNKQQYVFTVLSQKWMEMVIPVQGTAGPVDKCLCPCSSSYSSIYWSQFTLWLHKLSPITYSGSSGFGQVRGPGSRKRPGNFQSMADAQVLWLPLPRKDERTTIIPPRIIDAGHQEEVGHRGIYLASRWYTWSFLSILCPNIRVNWWMQQP